MNIKKSIAYGLIVLLLFTIGCEPKVTLEIKNNTSKSLEVSLFASGYSHTKMDSGDHFEIEPATSVKVEFVAGYSAILEARDQLGNVVYSKYFDVAELDKAKRKIVINESDLISQSGSNQQSR